MNKSSYRLSRMDPCVLWADERFYSRWDSIHQMPVPRNTWSISVHLLMLTGSRDPEYCLWKLISRLTHSLCQNCIWFYIGPTTLERGMKDQFNSCLHHDNRWRVGRLLKIPIRWILQRNIVTWREEGCQDRPPSEGYCWIAMPHGHISLHGHFTI